MALTHSLGVCTGYDELCDHLYVASCNTASASITVANEGHNIFLVKRNDPSMGDRVLSISKIEPVEFLILKEMKTALRSFVKYISYKTDMREIDMNSSQLK